MAIIDSITIGRGKGSLGNVTLRKGLGGVTIASQKVAKKGSSVGSYSQMKRRVQLANIVNMWQAFSGTLHPSFEDKKANNTDYNAFVKANLGMVPVFLTKSEAAFNGCVVAPFQVTRGSMKAIEHDMEIPGKVTTDISLGELTIDNDTTIADFTRTLLAKNTTWAPYDQLSVFVAQQFVDSDTHTPRVEVEAYEVTLSTDNEEALLSSVFPLLYVNNIDGKLGNRSAITGGICYVHSRKSANGTIVSTQKFVVNNSILANFMTAQAREKSILSYGGSRGDDFLTPDVGDILAPNY